MHFGLPGTILDRDVAGPEPTGIGWKVSRTWGVRAPSRSALLGIASAGLVIFSCVAAIPASGKSPPMPTQKQMQGCARAVTGAQPMTARQVAECRTVVRQTFLPEKCSEGPPGYLIDLMGGYRGIHGKAAHEWAIRSGHRPFRVRSDQTTQVVLDANIC
jgi:hypothetical protein